MLSEYVYIVIWMISNTLHFYDRELGYIMDSIKSAMEFLRLLISTQPSICFKDTSCLVFT